MNENEARKIAGNFHEFLNKGDDNLIKFYTKKELLMALSQFHHEDKRHMWYKAMIDRVNELSLNKFTLKDYISYGIGIAGVIIAVILGLQNQDLKDIKKEVYYSTQAIQQNNYYSNLPIQIKMQINKIADATADTVKFIQQ